MVLPLQPAPQSGSGSVGVGVWEWGSGVGVGGVGVGSESGSESESGSGWAGGDQIVRDGRGADQQATTATGRAIALIDRHGKGRGLGAGCGAGHADQGPAIGRAIALGDRRADGGRREGGTSARVAIARTDALVHRDNGRAWADTVEVVRDLGTATECATAPVDRAIALVDRDHGLGEGGRDDLAGRLRGAGSAVTLADRDRRRAAARGDRVDDRDFADEPKAARVVDTVAARRGSGDCRGGGRRRGATERSGRQHREGKQAGEEECERATHRDICEGRASWPMKSAAGARAFDYREASAEVNRTIGCADARGAPRQGFAPGARYDRWPRMVVRSRRSWAGSGGRTAWYPDHGQRSLVVTSG